MSNTEKPIPVDPFDPNNNSGQGSSNEEDGGYIEVEGSNNPSRTGRNSSNSGGTSGFTAEDIKFFNEFNNKEFEELNSSYATDMEGLLNLIAKYETDRNNKSNEINELIKNLKIYNNFLKTNDHTKIEVSSRLIYTYDFLKNNKDIIANQFNVSEDTINKLSDAQIDALINNIIGTQKANYLIGEINDYIIDFNDVIQEEYNKLMKVKPFIQTQFIAKYNERIKKANAYIDKLTPKYKIIDDIKYFIDILYASNINISNILYFYRCENCVFKLIDKFKPDIFDLNIFFDKIPLRKNVTNFLKIVSSGSKYHPIVILYKDNTKDHILFDTFKTKFESLVKEYIYRYNKYKLKSSTETKGYNSLFKLICVINALVELVLKLNEPKTYYKDDMKVKETIKNIFTIYNDNSYVDEPYHEDGIKELEDKYLLYDINLENRTNLTIDTKGSKALYSSITGVDEVFTSHKVELGEYTIQYPPSILKMRIIAAKLIKDLEGQFDIEKLPGITPNIAREEINNTSVELQNARPTGKRNTILPGVVPSNEAAIKPEKDARKAETADTPMPNDIFKALTGKTQNTEKQLNYRTVLTRFFSNLNIENGKTLKNLDTIKVNRNKKWYEINKDAKELIITLLQIYYPDKGIQTDKEYKYDELYNLINSSSSTSMAGGSRQSPKRKGTRRNLRSLLNKKRHTKKQ